MDDSTLILTTLISITTSGLAGLAWWTYDTFQKLRKEMYENFATMGGVLGELEDQLDSMSTTTLPTKGRIAEGAMKRRRPRT